MSTVRCNSRQSAIVREEHRSRLRCIFQGKSLSGGCHPHTPLAIQPYSKLQSILAFSHKPQIFHLELKKYNIHRMRVQIWRVNIL